MSTADPCRGVLALEWHGRGKVAPSMYTKTDNKITNDKVISFFMFEFILGVNFIFTVSPLVSNQLMEY